jgi:hypothetical protein
MSLKVRTFQDTPNPNALKCVLNRRVAESPKSYFKPEDAAADPFAASLFAIPGVTNILIHSDWITVSKRPDADWKSIKSGLERVLHDTPG